MHQARKPDMKFILLTQHKETSAGNAERRIKLHHPSDTCQPPLVFDEKQALLTATSGLKKIDTVQLHQKLPWQARTLLKFFPPAPKSVTTIATPQKSFFGTLLEKVTNRHIKTALLFCLEKFDQFMGWCGNHRQTVSVVGKSVAGLYIGVFLIRRLVHWYTGVSEYELLLDEQDMQYQAYGRLLDPHTTQYIAQLQAVSRHLPHEDCVPRLVNALVRPCFPYKMKTYAEESAKDVGILQLQLQLQIDGVLGRLNATHEDIPGSAGRNVTASHTYPQETHPLLAESIHALHVLHTGVVLLQMREVEATLRLLRNRVLQFVNICEDLLERNMQMLKVHSQSLRIPVWSLWVMRGNSRVKPPQTPHHTPHHTIHHTPEHTDTYERIEKLNAYIRSVYRVLGGVQAHLRMYAQVRGSGEKAGEDAESVRVYGQWVSTGVGIIHQVQGLLASMEKGEDGAYYVHGKAPAGVVYTHTQAMHLHGGAVLAEEILSTAVARTEDNAAAGLEVEGTEEITTSHVETPPLAHISSFPISSAIVPHSSPMAAPLPLPLPGHVLELAVHGAKEIGTSDGIVFTVPHSLPDILTLLAHNLTHHTNIHIPAATYDLSLSPWMHLPAEGPVLLEKGKYGESSASVGASASVDTILYTNTTHNASNASNASSCGGEKMTGDVYWREGDHAHPATHDNRANMINSLVPGLFPPRQHVIYVEEKGGWLSSVRCNLTELWEFLPLDAAHNHTYTQVRVRLNVSLPASLWRSYFGVYVQKEFEKRVEQWRTAVEGIDGVEYDKSGIYIPLPLQKMYTHFQHAPSAPKSHNTTSSIHPSFSPSNSSHSSPLNASMVSYSSLFSLRRSLSLQHHLHEQIFSFQRISHTLTLSSTAYVEKHLAPPKNSRDGLGGVNILPPPLSYLFSPRFLLRGMVLVGLGVGGVELHKYRGEVSGGVEALRENIVNFWYRRLLTPTKSIVQDVVFNKRTAITDQSALLDAKRSLSAMIYDFMLQHYPKMSEADRRRFSSRMDMSPISEEYERELKRPIQSIVSGRIARIVLIQLQFVKKELLVAMQAIDELFNANQVNLQLLSVTPAILALLSFQSLFRMLTSAIKSASRGKVVESLSSVHRELRAYMRDIERLLNLEGGDSQVEGHLLAILYRVQSLLVVHSNSFDHGGYQQLQEDLRDLLLPSLTVQQRLLIVDRIYRTHSFMQPPRRVFAGGFLQ
eukprot:gene25538-30835_t